MSDENGTVAGLRVFNVSGYHSISIHVKIKHIKSPDVPLCAVSLSLTIYLLVALHTYGFFYPLGTLSVMVNPGISAEDLSTLLTGGVIVRVQVLTNVPGVLFIDGCHY